MPLIDAVLLDVGGIFHLPDHDTIAGALARCGFDPDRSLIDRAHYAGAARFVTTYEGDLDWRHFWDEYLDAYVGTLGVPAAMRADALEHLTSEFASAGIWTRVIGGSKDALVALRETGARLGIVSNADGSVGARLREQEVLQVGPGMGVQVECVIDSGEVGVQKPDPRIFRIALDAMGIEARRAWYVGDMPGIDVVGARAAGIHAIVMDPFGFHEGADYPTVRSLRDVAALVAG